MYKKLNTFLGWGVFLVAAYTYCSTAEPTASFWDCGEFISSAFKLEVGHPPGNPFFMLVGNFLTHFAKDTGKVAMMVNCMSALLSAFTILFLFWTITHLTRKLVQEDCSQEPTFAEKVKILGSGVVGALVYTWSDTFWFSAVEGEVYAFSSFLTAIVFWLILKWEEVADKPQSDRWIVLIAYIMGLSIGVHLLNLLCIPAIVLVYYFRRTPQATLKGTLCALLISFAIVLFVLYGLIQGLVEVAGYFELFFVNTLGLPFQSGVIAYLLCTIAILVWGLYETEKQNSPAKAKVAFALGVTILGIPFIGSGLLLGLMLIALMVFFLRRWKTISFRWLNTTLLCLVVMFVGYSAYALIVIRSVANTPMDQNSPEDIFTLGRYLNREQYGETPLFYGRTFASFVKREAVGNELRPVIKEGEKLYAPQAKRSKEEKDHYEMTGRKETYVMDERFDMLFPRMYSEDGNHVSAYKEWSGFKGTPVRVKGEDGKTKIVVKPTFWENLKFFFSYQVNFMYWRYFMWNFSGRQTEIQGNGEPLYGNWITGIKFIDEFLVGPQDNLPPVLAKNKGRNVFYMLPLLLGIIGILYQVYGGKKGKEGFWITFFLFFMTGIAIVLYLNQTPYQPRERDYAYAGSFYAFSIWVGMGVAGLASLLEKRIGRKIASGVSFLLGVCVPFQMVSQTWDDHDRSNRTPCRDFGRNYLESCPPNAVLFTVGDNDTFPLWYDQEVEGFRTDVRVCNLSYLQTDWYIDQMRRPAYQSAPLQLSMKPWQYMNGGLDVAYIMNLNGKEPLDLKLAMQWLLSEDEKTKRVPGRTDYFDYLPDDVFTIKVDKEAVIRAGIVERKDSDLIVDEMQISLRGKHYVTKVDIAILDLLSNNDWTRPILFSSISGNRLDLNKYMRLEGFAYRLVPLKNVAGGQMIDADRMYDNMMNKFHWAGLDLGNDIYVDETFMNMCKQARVRFGQLIQTLVKNGDKERALKALRYCEKVLPETLVPYDYTATSLGASYYAIGMKEEGDRVLRSVGEYATSMCDYIHSLPENLYLASSSDMGHHLAILREVLMTLQSNNQDMFMEYYNKFMAYQERMSKQKS